MIETKFHHGVAVAWTLFAAACMAPSSESVPVDLVQFEPESESAGAGFDQEEQAAPAPRAKVVARRSRGLGAAKKRSVASAVLAEAPVEDLDKGSARDGVAENDDAAPARSWFPETFLFAPLVATDATGAAQLRLTVPDRLTTWRILALAHDRQGGRGGSVTTFDSVLPTYVDPVLPDGLVAGDRIELPVLVVNTTDGRVRKTLNVQARGAGQLRVSGAVELGPRESLVRFIPIDIRQPGLLGLSFRFGGADRVEKQVPVVAPGRPMNARKTGALADAVAFDMPLAAETRPESIQVGLTVYPGAMALLRSELGASASRMGLAEAAYTLHVAGVAAPLITRLGGKPDPAQLRKLRLQAGQRLLSAARRPTMQAALLIALGVGPHGEDPLLGRLKRRMAELIAGQQRPDGTFTEGDGWPLQRVVVATAAALHALMSVADDEPTRRLLRGARIRAEGAFERYIEAVKDPYTAASILAVDGVRGSLADKLRTRVRAALKGDEGLELRPGPKVVRVDGVRPSIAEATALAVIALKSDAQAKDSLPRLGNALLAAYRPHLGWGDGRTNLVALFAATHLFAEPLPDRVNVSLFNGDELIAETLLAGPDRSERHEVRTWAPAAVQRHQWRVVASPPVPGLAYAFEIDYRVPWKAAPVAGLTLTDDVGRDAKVGALVPITVVVDGPGGAPLEVRYGLPAGVQPVRSDWEAMVRDRRVDSFRVDARGIDFKIPRRAPGKAAKVAFRVVPSFAGRLQAAPSFVGLARSSTTRVDVAPKTWTVRR